MNPPEADDSAASAPAPGAKEPARCGSCRAPLSADAIGSVCPRCMFDAASSEPDDEPCEVFAGATPNLEGYRMVRELGRGGMGVVWLAEQLATAQLVAVKFCNAVRSPLDEDPQLLRRFQREMEVAARFKHPQFARVFDGGEVEGVPYCVMEYVEGEHLGTHVREGALGREQIVELMEKVCRAVEHAHAAQILHRDLKPSNILVTAEGEPKVLDFGLAKALADDGPGAEALSLSGHRLGTPAYMSPEQVQGRALDPASDVFSLGVILFEMLTRRHPHGRGSSEELMHRIATEEPLRPRTVDASVDRALELILLKALARTPAERYPTAGALAADLACWRRGERPSVGGSWAWAPYLSRRWLRSHRVLVGVLAAALVCAIAAVAWDRHGRADRRRAASAERVQAARIAREEDDLPREALVDLAAALKLEPGNREAAAEAFSQLVHTRDQVAPWAAIPALRHEDRVGSAVWSADGRRVLTASTDGTAQIWEVATGQPVGPRLRHAAPVVRAEFSPQGDVACTASNDGTARLWTVENGAPRGEPLRHEGRVTALAFSPDGRWLATASEDRTARCWDAATGQPIDPVLRHAEAVLAFAFSPDGSALASASDDRTVRLWKVTTGEALVEPLAHSGRVADVRFSPDGRLLLSAAERSLHLWDARSGQAAGVARVHAAAIRAARFSPDGTRVLAACEDGLAVLWGLGQAGLTEEDARWLEHGAPLLEADFSPDGCLVVTAAQDGTARVWEVETGALVGLPLRHGGAIRSARFSPDGLRILTASDDRTAQLWRWGAGNPAEVVLHHGGPVTRVVYSRDGRHLLTAAWDGAVRLWNAETALPAGPPLEHPTRVAWADFSPDGKWVVSAAGSVATRWELATGQALEPRLVHEEGWIASVAFSPDGSQVLTAGEDGTVRLWDAPSGAAAAPPLVHPDAVRWAGYSGDGRWIVTACADRVTRLWDAHSLAPGPISRPLGDRLRSAMPDADGGSIVLAGDKVAASIWEPQSGRLWNLTHGSPQARAAFSADGRSLVTAGFDGTARRWHAASRAPFGAALHHARPLLPRGQPMDEIPRTSREVWDAAFSPDGKWIATAGADGAVRLWENDAAPGRAPRWLPDFLETLAGQAVVSTDGTLQSLTPEMREHARRSLLQIADDGGPWDRLRKWVLADPQARAISPASPLSVAAHVEREVVRIIEHRNGRAQLAQLATAAREAYRLQPNHPLIHFALGASAAGAPSRAAFLYDYGLARLPEDPAICRQAERLFRSLGESERADRAAEKAAAR